MFKVSGSEKTTGDNLTSECWVLGLTEERSGQTGKSRCLLMACQSQNHGEETPQGPRHRAGGRTIFFKTLMMTLLCIKDAEYIAIKLLVVRGGFSEDTEHSAQDAAR